MSKKLSGIFLILILFFDMAVSAQDDGLYLSTCHDAYFPGQDINLKIWKLFDESKLQDENYVFVELLSASTETVAQKIVECDNEGAAVRFQIPGIIPSGFYELRAYTSATREEGESHFAYRKIMILNPAIDNEFPFPEKRRSSGKTIRAEFFPSGGKIVKGILNRIYVKFDNLPAGALEDAFVFTNYDDTLAMLNVIDPVTAYFEFLPYSGDYEIRMPSIFPHRRIKIPDGESSAFSLQYTEILDEIQFRVMKNDTALDFQDLKIKIENINSDEIRLMNVSEEMYLTIDELGPGLNRFSLVSEIDSVLSENYYLKKEEGRLSIKYINPLNEFKPREEVTFQVEVTSDQQIPDNVSLNILTTGVGRDLLPQPGLIDYYNYRQYLYLEPEWDPGNLENLKAIEVIYGPQLFKNKTKVPSGKSPVDSDQYRVNGHFHDGNTSGMNIYLSFPGDSSQLFITRTDADGRFSFPVRSAHGKKELFVKSEDSLNTGFISITERFFTDPAVVGGFPSSFDSLQRNYLDRLYQEWLLNQVYEQNHYSVSGQNIRKPMFYDKADFYLSMDNFVELPNMEEVFFEIVKPVMILREDKKPYLKVIDRETNRTIGSRPLYVIDGVPFSNPQIAFGLSPVNVRDISIVARKYFFGRETFDGIIIINTRSNNLSDLEPEMVYLRQDYIFPEKSSLMRINSEPDSEHKPYNPSVLYWNSNLKTDSEGRAAFSFVTPDIPGKYIIRVEAMDLRTGIPGFNSLIITVRDN